MFIRDGGRSGKVVAKLPTSLKPAGAATSGSTSGSVGGRRTDQFDAPRRTATPSTAVPVRAPRPPSTPVATSTPTPPALSTAQGTTGARSPRRTTAAPAATPTPAATPAPASSGTTGTHSPGRTTTNAPAATPTPTSTATPGAPATPTGTPPATGDATPPASAPQETVINPKLAEYLEAHPEIKTVQDLVNATYNEGKYDSTAKELGLDPAELARYRSANLIDYAVIRQPPAGTLPRTVDEANQYHLAQYNTAGYGTDFNNYFEKTGDFSNNCGPASLAMTLRVMGEMPAGLNPEQQIDYARALISGTSNQEVTVDGQMYQLYDKDLGAAALVGNGQIAGGAAALDVPAQREHGWGALNDALAAGQPVVAAGFISSDWKNQFPEDGHYGSAGNVGHFIAVLGKTEDGKYLVSDPMYANGAVEMTAEQLQKFVGDNPDVTTVGAGG